jgi:CelD/BcsL family acetyltransferase involved in cellulose biosynthesis
VFDATPKKTMPVETHERFEEVATDWDDLADRAKAAPWLRPGWIARWWKAFGNGRPHVIALREDGRLTGVLPLYERRGALLSPTNWHTPEFGAVTESGDATELAIALLAQRPRRIQLGWLEKSKAGFDECRRTAEGAGYRLIVRTLERSPYVDTSEGWDRYEASLSSKLLRELRRRRRALEARGALTFEVSNGTERLDELLDEGFRIEGAAWKAARGSAIDSQPATRSFYREIAHWAAERGSLRLGFLRFDETPFAFDFCLEESGIHYLLKTGYDPEYRASAPGQLMRYLMIEKAFAQGLDSYEFLGTDEPWKLEWSQKVRARTLLQAFAPSPAGRLDWAAFAFGRPLVNRMYGALKR